VFLDRSLSADLHVAGLARLERAAIAADELVKQHLDAMHRRYSGVIGTPQFVANLESGHQKTLRHYAGRISRVHGAALTMFLDPAGGIVARDGDPALADFDVGRTVELKVPTEVTLRGDVLRAQGEFELNHADLGMQPFSVMMGALQVGEKLSFSYDVVARR